MKFTRKGFGGSQSSTTLTIPEAKGIDQNRLKYQKHLTFQIRNNVEGDANLKLDIIWHYKIIDGFQVEEILLFQTERYIHEK